MHKKFKRFGVDAAGYGLILLGILLGWLPGPGGIPLILGGLGLLSVHNHWAKRILVYLQVNGLKFMELIFPHKAWAQWLHDILVVCLLGAAGYLLIAQNGPVYFGLTFALTALAIVDFLYNRDRLKKLKK